MRTRLIFLLGILSYAADCLIVSWKFGPLFLVTTSVHWLMNKSWFFVVCCDMLVSSAIVLLIFVYFFDPVVLEKSSVCWLSIQSRVFVVCQSIFCVSCCDMFLSTAASILLLVHLFDPNVLETPSSYSLLLGRPPCSNGMQVVGRWCFTPCTETKDTLDSVPY